MDLVYFVLTIVLIIALTELIKNIKNNRPSPKVAVIFIIQFLRQPSIRSAFSLFLLYNIICSMSRV